MHRKEMATALRRSKEDVADAAQHQRLVDKLEEDRAKQQESALFNALQVAAASIGEGCPKPSDQPRDAARREECSDLDEKSLTTFCRLDERAKGSDGDHLNDFIRLKRTTQNDALVEGSRREYPSIRQDHDVAVCPIPGTYVELQDLQFKVMWQ
jgi:hypothetical protein